MTDPAPRAPPIPPTGPSLAARDPGQAAVKRILVVDDETQIRAFLKTLLGRRTHGQAQVDDCGSAEDALKALESKRYDLVITDYKMGRLTGIDLLESARSRYPGMARILMTAYDDSTIACEAVERGSVDGFVSKPFNTKQVQTLVESLLGNHISAPPPPATAPAPATAPKPAMRPAPKPAASPPPSPKEPALNAADAREEIVRIDHALRHLRVQFGLGRLSSEGYRSTTADLMGKKARLEVWLLQQAQGGII